MATIAPGPSKRYLWPVSGPTAVSPVLPVYW
jgi:hypothetical protein